MYSVALCTNLLEIVYIKVRIVCHQNQILRLFLGKVSLLSAEVLPERTSGSEVKQSSEKRKTFCCKFTISNIDSTYFLIYWNNLFFWKSPKSLLTGKLTYTEKKKKIKKKETNKQKKPFCWYQIYQIYLVVLLLFKSGILYE